MLNSSPSYPTDAYEIYGRLDGPAPRLSRDYVLLDTGPYNPVESDD